MKDVLQRLLASTAVRGQAGVFFSQLTLNLVYFAIVFAASLILDTASFATLSLGLGWITVLANVFGFGADQAALKLGFEARDPGFIAMNVIAKGLLFAVTLCATTIAVGLFRLDLDIAVICTAAAGVAFWSATRAVEQFRRRFTRLAGLNLALACTRTIMGAFALPFHNSAIIMFAVHVLAQIPIHVFTLVTTLKDLRGQARIYYLLPMIKVAPIIFLSSTLFGLLPILIQQTFVNRGDTASASAFGVVQLFIAPISVLLGTLRMYFLPRILDPDARPTLGKHHLLPLLYLWICLGVGACGLIGVIIPVVYGQRLPLAAPFALSYLSAYLIVAGLGVLNLGSQKGHLIAIDLITNALRFAATWLICLWIEPPLTLVTYAAVAMIVGELILRVLLALHSKRIRNAPKIAIGRDFDT